MHLCLLGTELHTINNFLFKAQIDNINLFKVLWSVMSVKLKSCLQKANSDFFNVTSVTEILWEEHDKQKSKRFIFTFICIDFRLKCIERFSRRIKQIPQESPVSPARRLRGEVRRIGRECAHAEPHQQGEPPHRGTEPLPSNTAEHPNQRARSEGGLCHVHRRHVALWLQHEVQIANKTQLNFWKPCDGRNVFPSKKFFF